MKTRWIILAVCLVALAATAVGYRLTVQAEAVFPADQAGPYKVGFLSNTYLDITRTDFAAGYRPIQTFIWYPAADDNDRKPMLPAVYPMRINGVDGLPDASSTEFEAHGADPAYQEVTASDDGPFPLVVFSPGAGADALSYVHVGTRLASHGFIVAIPTNFDDKVGPTGQPAFYSTGEAFMIGATIERTIDVQFLMTQLVADSQQTGGLLSGTIRSDQIAVAGHSLGGLAALALAGGDDQVCDWTLFMDPNNIPPETCIPIQPDPRIKAIVSVDGTSYALKYDELARIKIPSMLIGQEWNTLDAFKFGIETLIARPHAAIQGQSNYRVDIAYANHNSFSSVCAILHVLNEKEIIDDQTLEAAKPNNCPPDAISAEEVQNLVTQYMIAFLKTNLTRERSYKKMLTTSYALENEPFIEFFETEKTDAGVLEEEGYFGYFLHQPGLERATALKNP
jgi:predicted dienelactone hydrolase